jgi:hypothetical protein
VEETPALQVVYEKIGGKILKILIINDRLSDEQVFPPAGASLRLASLDFLRQSLDYGA